MNALLTQFFGSTDPASLSSVENLRRVYDAYAIVQTSGLTASALISAITNAPRHHGQRPAVGAARPVRRGRLADRDRPDQRHRRIPQRDALVAYILQQLGDSYAQSCRHRAAAPAPLALRVSGQRACVQARIAPVPVTRSGTP